jgi:hypothetical protein
MLLQIYIKMAKPQSISPFFLLFNEDVITLKSVTDNTPKAFSQIFFVILHTHEGL